MSDIVERLRDHDRHVRGRLIEGLPDLCIDDMVEAADEIERLREQLKAGIAQRYWDDKQPYTVGECKAYEIGFTDGEVFGGMEARDECRDEIRRLREALHYYADKSHWHVKYGDTYILIDEGRIARAALGEGE